MNRTALALAAALAALVLTGCADGPLSSRPAHPSTGRKIALRTISNKTQQFGLEDTLLGTLRDEFLRDGRYQLVPESEADGILVITLTHYILAPLAYDVTLSPITYKLRIQADVQMLDRVTGRELWKEENLEGSLTYPNQILAGGQSEDQARATIWTVLSPMIVSRAADGFDVPASTAPTSSPAVK